MLLRECYEAILKIFFGFDSSLLKLYYEIGYQHVLHIFEGAVKDIANAWTISFGNMINS